MSTVGANNQDWVCKFQFFDRDTGQWSAMLSPQIGFGETFVQDETTDDGSLNFKWRSSTKPNIQHMQWARILHFHKGDNMVATYDEDGLPLNHNQYVIGDFQMAQSKDKSYWLAKLSLLEPIERMRFVVGETLAFTNQTSKTVTDGSGNTVTYVKEPYNHLTALERFLKVTPANCDNYDEGYNPHNNKSWYNRIKILDKYFLQNIPFDSDSFTEPDLYTILFKYDKSTGRTPCMFFDMNPETDLPRNLNRDEYILKFLRQDGFDKPVLNLADITANAQNVTYKSSLSNFATGVVSNVENLVTGSNLAFPSRNFWAAPELNSTQRDTTSANTPDSGWGIRFPCPIKRINKISKLTCRLQNREVRLGHEYSVNTSREDGLEKYCFEEQEYINLTENDLSSLPDVFHYTEGDDFLYIKNYYYTKRLNSLWYYIEFEPLLKPKIEIGDIDYQAIYNQVDSQVDVFKYYRYLYKYLQSMSKCDLTIIKKHYHPDDMYEVGSLVYDEETGKKYMITGSSYQNLNRELLAVYQLNENHFRRNNSVKANKAIRSNVAISYDNLKERKTCLKETYSISFNNIGDNTSVNLRKKIFSCLQSDFTFQTVDRPQVAIIRALSQLKTSNGAVVDFKRYIDIPLNIFYASNALIFNITTIANSYIGMSKIIENYENVGSGYASDFKGAVISQNPVIYTDPFGEIKNIDIYFTNLLLYNWYEGQGNVTLSKTEYERIYSEIDTVAAYPSIDSNLAENLILDSVYSKTNVQLEKDMLEILNVSIVFEVATSSDIILFDNMFKLSAFNGYSDNYNITVYGFSQNKSLNDSFEDCLSNNMLLTNEIADNCIKMCISGNFAGVKSVLIKSNSEPVLIINNVDLHLQNNYLLFYI